MENDGTDVGDFTFTSPNEDESFALWDGERLETPVFNDIFIYWNYQLRRDLSIPMDEEWKDSWDLRRCWNEG